MNDKTVLQTQVHQWLGDITPAWVRVSPAVRSAFINAPTIEEGPTIFNENLSKEYLSGSLVAHHAQLVLHAINESQGI